MKTRHTPGPWNADNATVIYYGPSKADRVDCIVIGTDTDPTESRQIALVTDGYAGCIANANLIAAAPELFAALQDVASGCVVPKERLRKLITNVEGTASSGAMKTSRSPNQTPKLLEALKQIQKILSQAVPIDYKRDCFEALQIAEKALLKTSS